MRKSTIKSQLSRVMLLLTFVLVLVAAVLTFLVVNRVITDRYNTLANDTAQFLAERCDGKVIDQYIKSGLYTEGMEEVADSLEEVNQYMEGQIEYIYLVSYREVSEGVCSYEILAGGYDNAEEETGKEYTLDLADKEGTISPGAWEKLKSGEPSGKDCVYDSLNTGYGRMIRAWYPVAECGEDEAVVVMVECDLSRVNKTIALIALGIAISIIFIATVIFAVNNYILKVKVYDPLNKLSSYIDSYEEGGFAAGEIRLNTGNELETFWQKFKQLEEEIKGYMVRIAQNAKKEQAIETELNVARQIQYSALPKEFPKGDNFKIYGIMEPARQVGGDFFDCFLIDEKYLAVIVADVSDKGVPAAMFMMEGKALLRCENDGKKELSKVFDRVNEGLSVNNENCMFITAFEGLLDLETGKMTYVNAGHESPYIIKRDGRLVCQEVIIDVPLGAYQGYNYSYGELYLEEGDKFIQYTDGITEAKNPRGEFLGMNGLAALLKKHKQKDPMELVEDLKADVELFQGKGNQNDDLTILAMEYGGKYGD